MAPDVGDAQGLARFWAWSPGPRAERIEWIENQRRGHIERRVAEGVGRRLEAAHDPGMPAVPDEEPNGLAGQPDGQCRGLHRLGQGICPDEPVGPGVELVQTAHPAPHAGAMSLEAGTRRAAHRAGELLEAELSPCRAIRRRPDDVQHHLHARADALDEVLLGDEIPLRREIYGIAEIRGEDRLRTPSRRNGARERHLDGDEETDRRAAG